MTDFEFSPRAKAYLDAYKVWDEAATKIFVTREIERKNGRGYQPGALSLKFEVEKMNETLDDFAEELDISPVALSGQISALRREGCSAEQAVRNVILYLRSHE